MAKQKLKLESFSKVFTNYVSSAGLNQRAKKRASLFHIVSRGLYREQVLSFPVMDRKALKQAIEFELQSQPEQAVYAIGATRNNAICVYVYWLDPRLNDFTGFLLPESLVVGQALEAGELIKYDNGAESVFLAKNSQGIVSKVAQGMFANPEYFCASHGVSMASPQSMDEGAFQVLLRQHWYRIPWQRSLGLWHQVSDSSTNRIEKLSQAGLPFTILFTLYLLLSSAWTGMQLDSANQEAAQLRQAVGSALLLRNEVRDLAAFEQKLTKVEQASFSQWELWPAIVPLYEMGSQIERIAISDGVVNIRIRTDSSSLVLENLLNNAWVQSAKFSGPVRKTRGKEVVNVEVVLNQKVDM